MKCFEAWHAFGLSAGASLEDLKATYKKLALQYHPDKNIDRLEWAHEQMVRINTAHAALQESFQTRPTDSPPSGPGTYYPPQRPHADPGIMQLFETTSVCLDRTAALFARAKNRFGAPERGTSGSVMAKLEELDIVIAGATGRTAIFYDWLHRQQTLPFLFGRILASRLNTELVHVGNLYNVIFTIAQRSCHPHTSEISSSTIEKAIDCADLCGLSDPETLSGCG